MVIYLAGPLLSPDDKACLSALAQKLERAGHSLSWPGALFDKNDIEELGQSAPEVVFESCRIAMERCACVVALLDKGQIDGGTAWEVGYAQARGMPIYGLRACADQTGEAEHNRGNSVIQGCLSGIADNVPALLDMLSEAGDSRAVVREVQRRG